MPFLPQGSGGGGGVTIDAYDIPGTSGTVNAGAAYSQLVEVC